MPLPLQVNFKNLPHSDAAEELVRKRADKLTTLNPRIAHIRVVLEAPHRSQEHGNHFVVHIDIDVPGAEIVVGRDSPEDERQTDLYAAINESFRIAERQLRKLHGRPGVGGRRPR